MNDHVAVPLRVGGKKMRKRRELDALVAHSLAKRACSSGKHSTAGNGITSHDQLLSQSTDDQDDYAWSRVRTQSRCRTQRFTYFRTCGPFLLVTVMLMSLGFVYWLYFDIRQQISDYRIRIEQVSATSQNLPEELQKWHETSKHLEQNQTDLHQRISTMQKQLDDFTQEMKQLRAKVESQNEGSVQSLKTSVADLGSQINDFKVRIEDLENRTRTLQAGQRNVTDRIAAIDLEKGRTVPSSVALAAADNVTRQSVEALRASLGEQIGNLAKNVSEETMQLKQRLEWLEKDDKEHKSSIDTLETNIRNVSSHVGSIESLWLKMSENLSAVSEVSKNLSNQILVLKEANSETKSSMDKIQTDCQNYHNQYEVLVKEIIDLKTKSESKVNVPPQKAAAPPFVQPSAAAPASTDSGQSAAAASSSTSSGSVKKESVISPMTANASSSSSNATGSDTGASVAS